LKQLKKKLQKIVFDCSKLKQVTFMNVTNLFQYDTLSFRRIKKQR